jgi:S-methylmethionine-dependent homocysteine/selenocysteine methylase/phospholipid N-methyltransferase
MATKEGDSIWPHREGDEIMSERVRDLFETRKFLTNAGTETYLVFQQGFDLPEFCAFTVFEDPEAWSMLVQSCLEPILQAAADTGHGLMVDALVWRAQPDFIEKLGRDSGQLGPINAMAVSRTRESIDRWRQAQGHDQQSLPVLVAADIGPRGDGYRVKDEAITVAAACDYHQAQIQALANAGADLACALTMTSVNESIGLVEACAESGLPLIVSPTVETDGRLPDQNELGTFIEKVDDATGSAPLFYMVNCAHPSHLLPTLEAARDAGEAWLGRFRGFRANASRKSHAELDNSTELDRGNTDELARELARMQEIYDLRVVGGCCGTDHEHLAAIAKSLGGEPCPMTSTHAQFVGSIPEIYEEHLGPVLFRYYARDLAGRVDGHAGRRVLETACGTGIATEYLRGALPEDVEILATDLNEAMLDFARSRRASLPNVRFEIADACSLPFSEDSFDAVVCQFGFMFFPDKERAMREARRVLRADGKLIFNVWDSLARNPVPRIAHETIGRFFDGAAPTFMLTPFGDHEIDPIVSLLDRAGFGSVHVERMPAEIERPSARSLAIGLVEGNPGIVEIRERASAKIDQIVEAVAEAVREELGDDPVRCPLAAIVFSAR